MKHTITAMFDSHQDANEAVRRLEAAGVPKDDISLVSKAPENGGEGTGNGESHAGDGAGTGAALGGVLGGGAGLAAGLGALAIPGLGPVVAAGWLAATLLGAGAGAAAGGVVGSLVGAGVSEDDAHAYAEGLRRGGALVTVRAEDSAHNRIVDILDDEGTIDMNDREASWRKDGWSGRYDAGASGDRMSAGQVRPGHVSNAAFGQPSSSTAAGGAVGRGASSAPPMTASTPAAAAISRPATPSPVRGDLGTSRTAMDRDRLGAGAGRDEAIPIVEERLNVGKRDVGHGRVRVRSYAVETPVQEDVSLRREHVEIERRPTDRPVQGGDLFRDRTIEAEERAEEAVVAKDARVKEEVRLRKHADLHTETVRDTVRHTEVEVQDERDLQRRPGATSSDRR